MRIALTTSVMQRGRSGVGQHIVSLVRALLPAAARHEFTLFVLEEDLPLLGFAGGAMRLEPVREKYRPPVRNILWHQSVLPGLARRLGADVIHTPSYRRMLWRRPCALVSTIHDLAPFHMPGKYDAARMFYGRVVARRLARRQDEIIAVSQVTARDVVHFFGVPPSRVTVVPNGLDHEQFRPGSQALAREAVCTPRGLSAPFFLYVARLEHPAKNHATLIDAFGRFKAATGSPWRLVLAGSDWHGAGTIRELAAASPFARDICLTGFVPNEELAVWYRAADTFVFPSLYEGFGMPPLEAMACGCPVLSSKMGGMGETVGDAAGLLEPNDVEQIQAQLARAASDPAWRSELRAAGLERARAFRWSSAAEATLAVYERAAARRANPTGTQVRWGGSEGKEQVFTYSLAPAPAHKINPPGAAGPIPRHHDQTH